MISVESLSIPDVRIIHPERFEDERGFFSETYNEAKFRACGIDVTFVQDNHSKSSQTGTVRGLHFQSPPHAQSKLVRVLRGSIIDVAVDVRTSSQTYGQWVKAKLDAASGRQIFVPAGFLHGFVTLEPDTEVAYKVDAYYDKASDGSVLWNDKTLAIDWEIPTEQAILSDKDRSAQSFEAFISPF